MLNELGFVDTLLTISEIDLYEGKLSELFNQYAAVPSMHFGNALLISLVCFFLSKNILVRFGSFIYPVFVLWMIVITGNHFFLDAVFGGIVVLAPYPFMWMAKKLFPSWVWLSGGPAGQRKASVLMKQR